MDMIDIGFWVYGWLICFNMWIVEDVFFRFIVFLVEVDFFVWVFGDVYMLVMVFILVD